MRPAGDLPTTKVLLMKRVILATPCLEQGGVWKHMLDLADGYRAAGIEVALALPPAASPQMLADAAAAGFNVLGLEASLSLAADVWHMHLPKSLEWRAIRWIWQASLVRARLVAVTEHLPRVPATDATLPWSPDTPASWKKPGAMTVKILLKRLMLARANCVITVSEHSRRFVADHFHVHLNKIVAVPNGVALHSVVSPPPDDRLRIVSIGSLSYRKGFDILIEAAALAEQPWSIDIIGDGQDRPSLEVRARAVSEQSDVSFSFKGWLPGAAQASGGAHVLCLPSRSEAMPYAVLEAMACGRPVVASAVDGVPELVDHGATGLLVPAEDAAALAAALDRLANEPELRAAMGISGRRRLEDHFTVQKMVQRTLSAYRFSGIVQEQGSASLPHGVERRAQ